MRHDCTSCGGNEGACVGALVMDVLFPPTHAESNPKRGCRVTAKLASVNRDRVRSHPLGVFGRSLLIKWSHMR